MRTRRVERREAPPARVLRAARDEPLAFLARADLPQPPPEPARNSSDSAQPRQDSAGIGIAWT